MALKAGRVGVNPLEVDSKTGKIKGGEYVLPVATSSTLGGVKPVAKTAAMTQAVGVDGQGSLYTSPGASGGDVYYKDFTPYTGGEIGTSSGVRWVMVDNIAVAGYTPISASYVCDRSGYKGFCGIEKGFTGSGYSAVGILGTSSVGSDKIRVFYIKNENVKPLT